MVAKKCKGGKQGWLEDETIGKWRMDESAVQLENASLVYSRTPTTTTTTSTTTTSTTTTSTKTISTTTTSTTTTSTTTTAEELA